MSSYREEYEKFAGRFMSEDPKEAYMRLMSEYWKLMTSSDATPPTAAENVEFAKENLADALEEIKATASEAVEDAKRHYRALRADADNIVYAVKELYRAIKEEKLSGDN